MKDTMDKIVGILQKILGSSPELKRGLNEARILSLWPLAVGEQIAKHAQAVALKGHTIMISVNHPIWKQELHSNKRLALTKFNAKLETELGKPAGREFWVEDLFIVNPTKEVRGFQKK